MVEELDLVAAVVLDLVEQYLDLITMAAAEEMQDLAVGLVLVEVVVLLVLF